MTDYWKEFARQSSTEEFKVISPICYIDICSNVSKNVYNYLKIVIMSLFKRESKENAERAKGITYRYRKSAKGYAQLEQDLVRIAYRVIYIFTGIFIWFVTQAFLSTYTDIIVWVRYDIYTSTCLVEGGQTQQKGCH